MFLIGNGAEIRPLEMGRESPAHCWKSHALAHFLLCMFQVHTNSDDFCNALANLNQALSEENLAALQKIQKQGDLTEDQILVGVGVHLIKQLTGKALTNRKKSETKCPCGCEAKLEVSRKMYIGKVQFQFMHSNLFVVFLRFNDSVNSLGHV